MGSLLVTFAGVAQGEWIIDRSIAVIGAGLDDVAAVDVIEGWDAPVPDAAWTLRGVVSNDRYLERRELDALVEVQQGVGRPQATNAALIPIRKTDGWWVLTQAERREILEASSHHIAIGLEYLPAVARRLHHSRDLNEPFDFLTRFEFAPADEPAFDELLARLRATPEWAYVEREVELRLTRSPI